MSFTGRCLVYGGSGALGKSLVQYYKNKNWWVLSIDLTSNNEANANIIVKPSESLNDQSGQIMTELGSAIGADSKLDAVLCVAGGWAGGNSAAADFVNNCDLMLKQSVWTSVIAASISSQHLKEAGMLVLTGAQAAIKPTSGMIGYGLAKAGVHHLVSSLASKNGGLPKEACVAAILPITLDTPMNRKFMPKADFSKWTPLETVAELLYNWSTNSSRPKSGSLVQLITEEGKTSYIPVVNSEI